MIIFKRKAIKWILISLISTLSFSAIWSLICSHSNNQSCNKNSKIQQRTGLTTIINSYDFIMPNVQNVLASSIDFNQSEIIMVKRIKLEIMKHITNEIAGMSYNDLEMLNVIANDVEGSILLDLKIINNKFQQNGQPIPEYTFANKIKIRGFKAKKVTEWSNQTNISDSSFSSIVANAQNYDKAQIQNFILSHKELFFINPPETFLDTDIVILNEPEYKTQEGIIVVDIGLKKWVNNNGQDESDPTGATFCKIFNLVNFRFKGITTTFDDSNLLIPNVSNVLASSIDFNNPNDQNVISIKQLILSRISNIANDQQLLIDDIVLLEPKVNNIQGSIVLKVQINNSKSWDNGIVVDSFTFQTPITLTGFHLLDDTINTTLRISSIDANGELFFNIFGNKGWAQDIELNIYQTKLLQYINENIFLFFNQPATDTKVSSIMISGDAINNPLTATISYNGYQQGIVQNKESIITINNFKTDLKGTICSMVEIEIEKFIEQKHINVNFNQSQLTNLENNLKKNIAFKINSNSQNLPSKMFVNGKLDETAITLCLKIDNNNLEVSNININSNGVNVQIPLISFELEFDNKTKKNIFILAAVALGVFFVLFIIIIIIKVIQGHLAAKKKALGPYGGVWK